MKKITLFLVIASLFSCIGCAPTYFGTPIASRDRIEKGDIMIGRTTREKVQQWFGEPYNVARLPDRDIYRYKYFSRRGDWQELSITIDNRTDTVQAYIIK